MRSDSSIFGSAPIFRLSLAFLGGVALCNFFGIRAIIIVFLFVIVLAAFLFFKRQTQQRSIISGIILLSLLFLLGVIYKKIDRSTQFKTDLPLQEFIAGG